MSEESVADKDGGETKREGKLASNSSTGDKVLGQSFEEVNSARLTYYLFSHLVSLLLFFLCSFFSPSFLP